MQTEKVSVETIVCRECGAENPGSRGFCAACGDTLWISCPECKIQVGVSESYCGGCGYKLSAWLEDRKQQAQAALAQSREGLAAKEFDIALSTLSKLSKDPAMGKSLQEEIKSLSQSIRQERSALQAEAKELAEQASQHLEKGACGQALELLQKIVPSLLTAEMQVVLDTAKAQYSHVTELSQRIDAALQGKLSVESLMDADRMLVLQPDHEKAWQLGEKLRDHVLKAAKAQYAQDNPERALKLLDRVPARFFTDNYTDLKKKVKEYNWLLLDIRCGTHVDRILVESANRIKKLFPQQPQINQLMPELSKRYAEASKDPLQRWKNWAKQESKPHFQFPVNYLRFDQGLENFEKLAKFKAPYATTFATAIGLAIGGLDQAEFSLSLELPAKKKFSLGNLNINIGGSKKKKRQESIGIDLGHSCLRVVRLSWEKGDRPRLEEALQIGYETAIGQHSDEHSRRSEYVNALRKMKGKMDFSKCAVVVSLPAIDAFFRVCPLPKMDKKQLQQVITHEAQHQIPFPLESVYWTHHLLADGDQQNILLFATKREAIERFALQFQMAEIEFTQMQAAPIALLNLWSLLRAQMESEDPVAAQTPTALLDIGHHFSTFIYRNKNEIALRILDVAGDRFTRKLVHAFNLTYEQAERLKSAPDESPYLSQVFEPLQSGFELLEVEMAKTLEVLKREKKTIPAVMYCSGGGSLLHGLIRTLRNGADSMIV